MCHPDNVCKIDDAQFLAKLAVHPIRVVTGLQTPFSIITPTQSSAHKYIKHDTLFHRYTTSRRVVSRPARFFLSPLSSLRSPQCRFQWQASICRNYYVYLPHSLKSAHRSGSSVFIVSCGSTERLILSGTLVCRLLHDLRHRHPSFFSFL